MVPVAVTVAVAERDVESVPELLTDGVAVEERLGVAPNERVDVGEAVPLGVPLIDGVTVAVGVEKLEGLVEAVPVADPEPVPVPLAVGVHVAV